MYAVIQTGGKQIRVEPGDTVLVEKLPGDKGDSVQFDEVLLFSKDSDVAVGQPLLKGALVKGEIVEQGRDKKIIVYKFQRRKNYRKKAGHRQSYTAVKINDVVGPAA